MIAGEATMTRRHRGRAWAFAAALAVAALMARTTWALTPLNDLGAGLYLHQFQGGLYPNASNAVPDAHAAEGLARAAAIRPLDTVGNPSADGKYVLLSIGMSNTTQEFCSQNGLAPCDPWTFMGKAAVNPAVNDTSLFIVNGAKGGKPAEAWDSPTDPDYNRIITEWLVPNGLSERQVQAAWVKVANPRPTVALPNPNADAYRLVRQMADISRALKVRYPNLQQVFLSSRIYAGYAASNLNPEPYAYESGLAAKWLIEAQINQMNGGGIDRLAGDLDYTSGIAPWLAWGPYLWADGLNPRSDGLVWEHIDLGNDGTHPSQSGEEKVGSMLLDFMLNSPFTRPWFLAPVLADFDDNGIVDGDDLAQWQGDFGVNALSDADNDGDSDGADFLAWQRQLGFGPSRASGSNDASAQSSGGGLPTTAAEAAVPEPSSASLWLFALLMLPHRVRRSLD